jgi:hypothetical protein
MPSVADLADEPALRDLVAPEPLAAGRDLADAGAVRFSELGPIRVVAEVADADGPHRVELIVQPAGLGWSCDCADGRAGLGCRHLAAAGIETWRRSPKRR